MNFNSIALSRFENYVKTHNYLNIRNKLRSAHIFKPYEEYVSSAILISMIIGFMGSIFGIIIGTVLSKKYHLSPSVVNSMSNIPGIGTIFNAMVPYAKYTTPIIFGIIIFLILGGIAYSIIMLYPTLVCSVRKTKIDTAFPHALIYMYSLSRGETNLVEIIRGVASIPDIYGEVSNEFAMVLRDMELLGIDFMHALKNVQKDTPSKDFKQFLGYLVSIIDNGGDITEFLSIQIDNFQVKKKTDHTLFLDLLSMIAEGYVTGFVAGPLFLIVTGVTIGSMQGGATGLLLGMTYVVIPFGSIGFIFLVDLMLPKDEHNIGLLKLKKIEEFSGTRIKNFENEIDKGKEKVLFAEYEKSKNRLRIKEILKNPLKAFFEEPALSLYISIPIGIMIILIPMIMNFRTIFKGYVAFSSYMTNYIVFGIIISLLPFIIFYEIKAKKLWNIESSMPIFLKNLSIINETGLSLAESLRVILRTENSVLKDHIERMYTDMSWGSSVNDAFTRFASKIKVNSLSRMAALITKASETSGDIRQVLGIATTDMNMNVQLKKDKSTNMLIYIVIIYISYFVFLYIVYTLATAFLPQMAKAAGNAGSQYIQNFDLEWNKIFFYHTALIQGFFSGMMAGVLGEGDYRLGFKHSVILMTIGFILFTFFVSV